ncbi:MAG: DNA repair protein RecO, partial [Candidatus Eremiobacteraeota bacterium]|nr:DNA repair protein RecO [Candidatus Eremiobacteraeota bacterium]
RERAYRTHAIVMRARNLGEADKIFTLFTQERGKIDAVAKGVRRAKSQLAGRLEFVTEVALMLHRGRTLDVITGAEIERASWTSIVDPAAFGTAHVIVELVDAFCEIDLAMPEIYTLLRGALTALAATNDPTSLVPRFQLRLLGALGYAPAADDCVRCGASLGNAPAWAELEAGGLACERCRSRDADGLPLGAADVVNFQGLAAGRRGPVRAVTMASPAAARAIAAFITWHLGKRTKSGRFLDDLARA